MRSEIALIFILHSLLFTTMRAQDNDVQLYLNNLYENDEEAAVHMEEAYEACREIITEHIDKLELIAQALIERETLNAKQLEELMEKGTITDEDSDEDDKPSDDDTAAPLMTPIPVDVPVNEAQQEAVPVEAGKDADEEEEELAGKATEPKFNVTHFDK